MTPPPEKTPPDEQPEDSFELEEEDSLLDQDELDALFAEHDKPEDEAKPAEEDSLLSQEDLDALLASAAGQAPLPPSTPDPPPAAPTPGSGTPTEDEGGSLTQAELDALIAGGGAAGNEDADAPAEDEGGALTQAELDALIAGGGAAGNEDADAPAEDEGGSLTQAELDALIAGGGAAGNEDPAETGGETALTQDELDALTRDHADETSAASTADDSEDEGLIDQAALDALIAASQAGDDTSPEPPAPEPDAAIEAAADTGDALLSQSELDRLVSESGAALEHDDDASEGDSSVQVLTEDELDDVLADVGADQPLKDADLDTLVTPAAGQDEPIAAPADDAPAPESLTGQEDIDAILAEVSGAAADDASADPQPATEAPEAGPDAGEAAGEEEDFLSQDLLDSLVSEAHARGDVGEVEDDAVVRALPADEELDEETLPFPGEAGAEDEPEAEPAPEPATEDAPSPAKPRRKRRFRPPVLPVLPALRAWVPAGGPLKVGGSLAAGLIAAVAAWYLMQVFDTRLPDWGGLDQPTEDSLPKALQDAQRFMETGLYQDAIDALDRPIANAPADHPLLPEAEFTRLQALYEALPEVLSPAELEDVQVAIDGVIDAYPLYERVPEALRWKAQLYAGNTMPDAARSVYRKLVDQYARFPQRDAVMLEAGQLALAMDRGRDAAAYARQMLEQYPTSRHVDQALLLLGDAYVMQGELEEAREVYGRLAEARPDSATGAEAFVRLARMALDEGRADAAITQLEQRLRTSTTVAGNDQVYLLLAQAYRARGDAREAAQVLRDLIAFFPETRYIPDAYVELTSVLEDLGERGEAMRLIIQASQRFPEEPDVLRALADMRALTDNPLGAAEALIAADEAGARDPRVLFDAARYFREAGEWQSALDTYDRLALYYPTSTEAFEGLIEMARVRYEEGRVSEALSQLQDLARLTAGRPRRLTVLLALGDVYHDLGFGDMTLDTYTEVASLATEPELLARSAIRLLQAGAMSEGLTVAQRVEETRIAPETAYALLNEQGQALLRSDPGRGIDLMERARDLYPEHRSNEHERALLDAYLATDRIPRARSYVSELEARSRRDPRAVGPLQYASLAFADYLYNRRDFQAARDAYALVERIHTNLDPEAQWARYQQGGALLHLEQFGAAIALFDSIAASRSEWAAHARVKAAYARAEQESRGLPVTPLPAGGGA